MQRKMWTPGAALEDGQTILRYLSREVEAVDGTRDDFETRAKVRGLAAMTWLAISAIPRGLLGHFSDEERDLPLAAKLARTPAEREGVALAERVYGTLYCGLASGNRTALGLNDVKAALPEIRRALDAWAHEE